MRRESEKNGTPRAGRSESRCEGVAPVRSAAGRVARVHYQFITLRESITPGPRSRLSLSSDLVLVFSFSLFSRVGRSPAASLVGRTAGLLLTSSPLSPPPLLLPPQHHLSSSRLFCPDRLARSRSALRPRYNHISRRVVHRNPGERESSQFEG